MTIETDLQEFTWRFPWRKRISVAWRVLCARPFAIHGRQTIVLPDATPVMEGWGAQPMATPTGGAPDA